MRRNSGVAYSQKSPGNDSSYFKAVETLRPDLGEDSLQRAPDIGRPSRSQKPHLYFARHETEVPSGSMDLAIESEAIESLDHAPFSGERLAL